MPTRFFYILVEGKVRGPFPEKGIVQLADQGRLPADARLSEDGRTWFAPEAVLPPGSVRTVTPRAEAESPAVSGPPPVAKRVRRRLPDVQLPKIGGRPAIIVAAVIGGIILFAAFSATVRQIATARKAGDDAEPPAREAGSTAPERPGDYGPGEPPVSSPPPTASPPEEDASESTGPSSDSSPAGTVADSHSPSSGPADGLEKIQRATVTVLTDTGQGSGFFIDGPSTYPVVVTNYHVVQGAGAVQVRLHDGNLFGVTRGAVYPQYDLAFMAVDGLRRPPAVLPLRQGLPSLTEKVFAYGAPLGFSGTVTEGIVSAVRTTEELDRVLQDCIGEITPYENTRWIQTTAAISPGNSGGPLVDALGRAVGVNTLALSPEMRAQNINFAVSADQVAALLPSVQMVAFPPEARYRGGDGGGDRGRQSETGAATLRYWLTMKAALQTWKEVNSALPQIEQFPLVEQLEMFVAFKASCEALIDFLNELDDAHVDREAIECKAAICDLMDAFVKSLQALVQDPGNPLLQGRVLSNLDRTATALNQAEWTARTALSRRYGVPFPSLF